MTTFQSQNQQERPAVAETPIAPATTLESQSLGTPAGRSTFFDDRATSSSASFPALTHSSPHSGFARLSAQEQLEVRQLATEIQRSGPQGAEIARELIRDISNPEQINQGTNATCTMTTLQKQLAAESPLEYARMIRNLAVDGSHTFNDPQRSTVTMDRRALAQDPWKVPEPYEARSTTERMVQNVLMRYAIGDTDQARAAGTPPLSYNQGTDKITGTYQGQHVEYRGLFEDQVMLAMQGVSGKKSEVMFTPQEAMPAIERELAAGRSVMVELNWASSGPHQLHALSVDHIDRATGTVYLYNPHGAKSPPPEKGAIQTLSLQEFESKFHCAFVLTDKQNDGRVPPAPAFEQVVEQQGLTPQVDGTFKFQLQVSPPTSAPSSKPSDTPTIIIKQEEAPRSPQFTIAHELPVNMFDSRDRAAEAAERKNPSSGRVYNTRYDDDLETAPAPRTAAAREESAKGDPKPFGSLA